jgi:ankyrin repeat protein
MRTPGSGKDFAMQLPDRPNLRHLRDQAKDLVRSGAVPTLAAAQFQIARDYGFPSWPKLKHHVETLEAAGQLRHAIRAEDLDRVKALLTANPGLHRGPREDGDDGPLSWAAECRGCKTPSPARLAIAQWLIDHGSDVHQGGDGPLCRAAYGSVPMMELLVGNGADVNGLWGGWFPVLFVPCENLDSVTIQWLLDHGADPNRIGPKNPSTALDYVMDTYVRDPSRLTACIEVLLAAGARTRYDLPGVLPILRGRNDELAALLDADPSLAHRRYPELLCGASGGRMLTLRGGSLLHVAAEFGYLEAARLLLDRGADVNARATIDADGVGGQTAVFHALTHFKGANPEVGQLLISRGADLTIRARVPGHYERPGEILDVSAAEYAALFPLR